MIAVMDSTVLTFVLKPESRGPEGITRLAERVIYLLKELDRSGTIISIPTPTLAEVLVHAGDVAQDFLALISRNRSFRVSDFDQLAAIEHAALVEQRLAHTPRLPRAQHARAKFDEQILAIAAVQGATTIYSDDQGLRKLAGDRFAVLGLADLPLPPEDPQASLDFTA